MAKKLLVVDSNLAIQKLVEYNLSREKFAVTCLNDGLSALDLLNQIDPDLILADFHLEGISFVRFCEKVKQKQSAKERAVLVLVSGTDSYDPGTLVSLGVVDFVKKPLEPKELIEKLKDLSQDNATLIDRAPRPATSAGADSQPEPSGSPTPSPDPSPTSKDQAEVMKIEELLGWSLPGEKSPEDKNADPSIAKQDDEMTVVQSRTESTSPDPVSPEPPREPLETLAPAPTPALEDSQMVIGLRTSIPPSSPATQSEPEDSGPSVSPNETPLLSSVAVDPSPKEVVSPQQSVGPETADVSTLPVPPTSDQAQPTTPGPVPPEMLEQLVSKMAKEVLEKVAWDVVPSMAETLIKEELEKLKTEKPA